MAKVYDLSNLDSEDGFFIKGDAPGDNAGWSVSGAGDVNGDGIADFIVGAPDGDDVGLSSGEAYVIFGRDVAGGADPFAKINLSDLDPADGFIIQGFGRNDPDYPYDTGARAGVSVSAAGDVNGDGIDDLIVGGPDLVLGYESVGAAFLIFGRDVAGGAAPFGTIDVDALDPADGIFFRGNIDYDLRGAFDREGFSVSGAGDINGDGFADLIIGAPLGDRGGSWAGEAYVIYGGDLAAKLPSSGGFYLYSVRLSDGFIIQGGAGRDRAGVSVSDAGDVNGDGIADLIVGAYGADDGGANAGAAYVVFGRDVGGGADAFPHIDLSVLDPADGFTIKGGNVGGLTGRSVSSAGDVNGDGIDDLIVGAPGANKAYVVYGRDVAGGADAFGTIDLAALDPADGFVIEGTPAGETAIDSVSDAGDVNGDGIDDLIVGAADANKAFVVFGRDVAGGASPLGSVELSNLGLRDGFTINGAGLRPFAGISVSGVGDINGDGFDDIIVGAPGGDHNGSTAGKAFVIFGQPVPVIRGDGSANTLVGSPDDEVLVGLGGDDVLIGGLGNDELRGGADDDTLRGGKGNDLLYGGTGNDKLSGKNRADVLVGNSGNDTLIGGRGDDLLAGNTGDDRLFGGLGDDRLRGNQGDDVLDGKDGNDRLRGGQGTDQIMGGAGDDTLMGGAGQDRLKGGAGSDSFVFAVVGHSLPGAGDTIVDFDTANDRIDLTRIDADTATAGSDEAFAWLGGDAFTGTAGELRFDDSGPYVLVQGDVDGDGAADIEIILRGNVFSIDAADFLL